MKATSVAALIALGFGWPALNATVLAATNPAPPTAAELPDKIAAAPGTSANRSLALSLLQKHAETMAKLRSYLWVEEVSKERQARFTEQPYAELTGKSQLMERNEFRTDGNRYSIRLRLWGNTRSAAIFTPEERSGYNRYLWDGKRSIAYTATMVTPGNVSIYTHRNEPPGWPRPRTPEAWWVFWDCGLAAVPSKASSLSVRTNLEQVGQAKCYVVEVVTPVADYSVTPLVHFTVYETVWLDPERGHNIVQATRLTKYERASTSISLERVTCREIEGIWIPVEGYRHRNDAFANNDSDRLVSHVKITEITLNPNHDALRSFVPDDIKNGAWVHIDPVLHQPFDPKQLPFWQDGRVVDQQGRILFDSGLKNTNTDKTIPAGKK